ncbi:MAG: RNA 2',3'-cyclic phosphodiesterase [Candidatus Eremiobacteraeota bacterium]|nr:RNA 2',3'-cyclic phosphodiesterase [Candidatus Eremiobacteraeota bacterium]
MQSLRLFYAIPLAPRLKATLSRHLEQCRAFSAEVKWVEVENLHLTLRFLGSVEQSRLPEFLNAGRAIAGEHASFKLFWEGFGAFPTLRSPRVLWVGISRGKEGLAALNRELERGVTALGLPEEKRAFSPHLTIGRVKGGGGIAGLSRHIEKIRESRIGEMAVPSFFLIKSTLTPKGPLYEHLEEFMLGAGEKREEEESHG